VNFLSPNLQDNKATAFVPNRRILYADDEMSLLHAFRSLMRKEPFEVNLLLDPNQIDQTLATHGPFALVISDQRMPGIDGVELLSRVGRVHPETSRVLMTGYASHDDTMRALNLAGINYYIPKPWNDNELVRLVHEQVSRYNLGLENRFLVQALEARTNDLATLLDGTVSGIVRLLGDLVGMVSKEAFASGERVRRFGQAALQLLPDVDVDKRRDILLALDLYQFGLAVLPAWIQVSLQKAGISSLGRLPNARNHNLLAAALLKTIPHFDNVANIVRLYNKNMDGTGDPEEEIIVGKDIPLGARLLHILVEFDRLSTPRFKGKEILQRMVQSPMHFDVNIIQSILGGVKVKQSAGQEWDAPLEQCEPGMILLNDIVTESRQCLLRADAVLSETSIAILKQWHASDPIVQPIHVRIPQ
jgi:response regulator RpfG family c-di-GMP phosphodiesterase